MPVLELSDEQVIELVKQLPPGKKDLVFKHLLSHSWNTWEDLSRYGEERIRELASERGKDWDRMTEEAREDFINDLVHEDRKCS